MAKKNEFGKFILSANEIATFVVCPEAWRLSNEKSNLFQKENPHKSKIKESHKLRDSWAQNFKDAIFYTRSVFLLLVLIVVTALFFLIRFTTK